MCRIAHNAARSAPYPQLTLCDYEPQPGDYLNRRDNDRIEDDNGHAMMMVEWDSLGGVATVIDGPWNINFREVNVLIHEQRSDPDRRYDYCVGRIPFND